MFFTLLKCVKTEKFKPLWNLIIHWNLIFQVSYAERFGVSNTARKYKTNRQYIYREYPKVCVNLQTDVR